MPNPIHRVRSRGRPRHQRGVTLIELAIVLAIAGLLVLVAAPNMIRWQRDQRLKGAARDIADLLLLARSESARTGNRHVVIFGPPGTADPSGTPIVDGGTPVPLLVLDDGAVGTANCQIDAGEAREVLKPVDGVTWGVSLATARAPGDTGAAAFTPPQASGGTFADPANNAVPWFLFRPDGIPVRFEGQLGSCGAVGTTALGGAAFYLTNGIRDYAVVLTPMGGVRVHVWDTQAGAWKT
jgi:prepilin-type N-terminal cleavage/methylation domain-containing protein